MKAKRLISIIIAAALVLSVPAGAFAEPVYERLDDDYVFEQVFGEFDRLASEANATSDYSERTVRYAKAEAAFLESAAFLPTTSSGGRFAMGRVAPHTAPYVMWGSDSSRLAGHVISKDIITAAERSEMLALWENAKKGAGSYDPAAYLVSKGHELITDYHKYHTTDVKTLDWGNTSSASDIDFLINFVDGLVKYDNLGQIVPSLAESWQISEDGTEYVFNLRQGVNWYTAEGEPYAELTAQDFVTGFRHNMDCDSGIAYIADGVVKGVSEYLWEGASFANVGIEATGKYTLKITLLRNVPYFMTMLSYTVFMPVCTGFYESRGGVFGISELRSAREGELYHFGDVTDLSSQVYCGAFIPQSIIGNIVLVKNPQYYDAVNVNVEKITSFLSDYTENYYQLMLDGDLTGVGLSGMYVQNAKDDGLFDTYAYVTDTNATTYFGALNLNRSTFGLQNGNLASGKTDAQKKDYLTAVLNKDFRKALMFAIDKISYNTQSVGEELAEKSLRNMLCPPDFISLPKDVDLDGAHFAAGTAYGDIVQYYLNELGSHINVSDSCNGWYDPSEARAALQRAKTQLGDSVTWPITIDYISCSLAQTREMQAHALKESIEGVLGTDNIIFNIITSDNLSDYYQSTLGSYNSVLNADMNIMSGWSADYGDVSTYISAFDNYGYMTKQFGLESLDGEYEEPEQLPEPEPDEAVDADGAPVAPEVDEETPVEVPITPAIASQIIKNVVIAVKDNDQTVLDDVPDTVEQEDLEETPAEELTVVWQKDVKVPPATKFPVTINFSVPNVKDWQEVFVYHFVSGFWQLVGNGRGSKVDATFDSLSPVAIIVKNAGEEPSSAYIKGDVNGDNEIDANDLTALSRHVAQIELITDAKLLLAADTDGSGSISADDLTVLSRYVAQIIKEFPEPNIEEYEVSMCPDDVHLG